MAVKINRDIVGNVKNNVLTNKYKNGYTFMSGAEGDDTYVINYLFTGAVSVLDSAGADTVKIKNVCASDILFLFDVSVNQNAGGYSGGLYITTKNNAINLTNNLKEFLNDGINYNNDAIPDSNFIEIADYFSNTSNGNITYGIGYIEQITAIDSKNISYNLDTEEYISRITPLIVNFLNTNNKQSVIDVLINGTPEERNQLLNIYNTAPINCTITGTARNDTITGGLGVEIINTGNGNDTIYCGGGNDTISGGKGNDKIYTQLGDNTVIVNKGDGTDTVYKGLGNDTILFSNIENLTVLRNTLKTVKSGNDLQLFHTLRDKLILSGFFNNAASVKTLVTANGEATELSDFLSGTTFSFSGYRNRNNQIAGTDYNDVIKGGSKNDTLIGGIGNDTLYGGAGNDDITGGTGTNRIVYDKNKFGNDTIHLTEGENLTIDLSALKLNLQKDVKYSTNGNDILITTPKGTLILSGYGIYDVTGESGSITLDFGSGEPVSLKNITPGMPVKENTLGSRFADILDASAAENYTYRENYLINGRRRTRIVKTSTGVEIDGAAGNDTITGSLWDDTITGGIGNDEINAGAGENLIYFNQGDGNDTITDGGGSDTLIFEEGTEINYTYGSQNLILHYGENDSITLKNYLTNENIKYIQIGNDKRELSKIPEPEQENNEIADINNGEDNNINGNGNNGDNNNEVNSDENNNSPGSGNNDINNDNNENINDENNTVNPPDNGNQTNTESESDTLCYDLKGIRFIPDGTILEKIVLPEGYSLANRFYKNDNNLVLFFDNNNGSDNYGGYRNFGIVLEDYFINNSHSVQTINQNGVDVSLTALLENYSYGYEEITVGTLGNDTIQSAQNQYIYGLDGNDVINNSGINVSVYSGAGDDIISSSASYTKYHFVNGYGNDVIQNNNFYNGTIVFDYLKQTDTIFGLYDDDGDLVISYGLNDSITVEGFTASNQYGGAVNHVEFNTTGNLPQYYVCNLREQISGWLSNTNDLVMAAQNSGDTISTPQELIAAYWQEAV